MAIDRRAVKITMSSFCKKGTKENETAKLLLGVTENTERYACRIKIKALERKEMTPSDKMIAWNLLSVRKISSVL